MTRGMIYVICDTFVLSSIQFNGDMYPSHYGLEIITLLQNSKDLAQIKIAIEKFNKEHHQYTGEIMILEERDMYFKGVTQFSTTDKNNNTQIIEVGDNAIDVTDNSDEGPGFNWTDWNFIKNLSEKTITMIVEGRNGTGKKTIELKPNQQVAINYDYYDRHYKTIKQCEKLIAKEQAEYERAEAKRKAEELKKKQYAYR